MSSACRKLYRTNLNFVREKLITCSMSLDIIGKQGKSG